MQLKGSPMTDAPPFGTWIPSREPGQTKCSCLLSDQLAQSTPTALELK